MTTTLHGVIRGGELELLEKPTGFPEGRVRVTIQGEPQVKPEPRFLEYGKYKGGRESTLDEFKEAEWHVEPEFGEFRE